ncbi:Uncharacterised protein [Yersinia pseudotuberculosis]|nr:Uncharacterised protein [Yersinia pseudotuberculosis]SUQ38197.1 Uncharacterised protein [Yersinia pseudotuberculosis]VEE73417.1 Uncharacterised protein [Yersinia pseudotuberculosis]
MYLLTKAALCGCFFIVPRKPPARLGIQLEYEGAIEIVPVAIEPHADAARQNSVQNNCMNMRNGNKRPINS